MKKWPYIFLFLLLSAIVIIGFQAISSPPVLDDMPEIAHVQSIQSVREFITRDCFGFFRPIKNLIFWVFLWLSPGNPVVWHLGSLVVYLLTTVIVVFTFNEILKNKMLAVLAGAMWAMAPTQVSVLAWLSCSNILVMTAGFFLALIFYERSQIHNETGEVKKVAALLTAACLFYSLALFSYESAIMFPLVVLLWDWLKKRSFWNSRYGMISYGSFWAVTFIYLFIRFLITKNGVTVINESFGPVSPLQVSFSSAYFTFDHFFLWLFPFGKQSLMAGTFIWGKSVSLPQLGGCWILFLAAVGVIFMLRKLVPLISFGLAWFFIAFIPLSNILPLKNGPFSDYYLIIPSFGLVIALIGLIRFLTDKVQGDKNKGLPRFFRFAAFAVCFLIVGWRVAAGSLCPEWARMWNSEIEIFKRSLTTRPYPFAAKASLARAYLMKGQLDEAEKLAAESLADASWFSNAYYVLGDVYMKRGDYKKAREIFMQAMSVNPEAPYPYFATGYIYETFYKDIDTALEYYHKVLSLPWSSYSSEAGLNLSRILAMNGNLDEAIEIMEHTLKHSSPALSAELHYNAAIAYQQKGDIEKGQKHLDLYRKIVSASKR